MVTQVTREAVHNPNLDIVDRSRLGLNDEGGIDVFEISATQVWPLGTRYQRGNKVFYYAKNAAVEIAAGKLCQGAVIETNGDVTDMAVDTPGIGDTQMEVTNGGNTAIAEDEFAGGECLIQDDTGEGYSYTIKGNDAMAASAAGTIFLWDKVQVALGAGATVALTHPTPFYNVIIHPSPPTAMLAGVTPRVLTASYYGWLQTWGPCAVLHDGSAVIVQQMAVRASEDDDGAVTLLDYDEAAQNYQDVGAAMHPTADQEHSLVWLKILP
tara:strand:+ start:3851 stop:4654 length:804 start_codon:yes stop_codon:yes gene_type:complete